MSLHHRWGGAAGLALVCRTALFGNPDITVGVLKAGVEQWKDPKVISQGLWSALVTLCRIKSTWVLRSQSWGNDSFCIPGGSGWVVWESVSRFGRGVRGRI